MAESDRERMIRQYAAGEISWHTMRERGFDSFLDDLAGLGALGLRQPVAPMEGPNVESQQRASALIREALKAQS
ncbi:hypothetical protein [Roseiarcus sp.]|uniref:hypothetical protein n=1 Tax=Roseiarcus sp. TaxID=1969460 RepID=UPI003F954A79